jgi:hypothetical protein
MANGFGAGGAIAGGILGLAGGLLQGFEQRRAQTKARRRQRRAIESARSFADERVSAITEGELFSRAEGFLSSTFGPDAASPLAEDTAKRIAAIQSSRGTFFGAAGTIDAAGGAAAALHQSRMQLLPSALQFAQAPEQLRQSILGFEAPLRVAAATGAPVAGLGGAIPTEPTIFSGALNSALAGAFGGFQLGQDADASARRRDASLAQAEQLRAATQARRAQQDQPLDLLSQFNLSGSFRRSF